MAGSWEMPASTCLCMQTQENRRTELQGTCPWLASPMSHGPTLMAQPYPHLTALTSPAASCTPSAAHLVETVGPSQELALQLFAEVCENNMISTHLHVQCPSRSLVSTLLITQGKKKKKALTCPSFVLSLSFTRSTNLPLFFSRNISSINRGLQSGTFPLVADKESCK